MVLRRLGPFRKKSLRTVSESTGRRRDSQSVQGTYNEGEASEAVDEENATEHSAAYSASVTGSRAGAVVTREVIAPPGKLGIVMDTSDDGLVIQRVDPSSPLAGSVFPGDIVIEFAEIDTRHISQTAITALMVQTAHTSRKWTVQSTRNW